MLFPIFSVESQHKFCVSAPVPSTVPSTRSRTRRSTAFKWPLVKRSRATFFAHQDLQGGATYRKNMRREKRLPVVILTARLLIVMTGEGSTVLPEGEPFSFQMINCMRKRLIKYRRWYILTSKSTQPLWAWSRNCPCPCWVAHAFWHVFCPAFFFFLLYGVSFENPIPHWKRSVFHLTSEWSIACTQFGVYGRFVM